MKSTIVRVVISLTMVLGITMPLSAQTKDELQARFKTRDSTLIRLRSEGKIGESYDGFVAVRHEFESQADVRAFIEAENSDRRALYGLLAREQTEAGGGKNSVTPEMVGAVNAARNVRNAKPTDWLLMAPETWIQKKDENRYRAVEKLKRDGKVGETASGYLEAVRAEYLEVESIKRVITDENRFRKEQYESQAKVDRTTAEKAASKRGEELVRRAPAGDYVKDASGWRKQ